MDEFSQNKVNILIEYERRRENKRTMKKTKEPRKLEYNCKPLKLPYNISYSKYSLFKDCPNRFFFKYLSDVEAKDVTWSSAVIGIAMHAVVEQWALKKYNENYIMTKEELLKAFDEEYSAELSKAKKESTYKLTREFNEVEYLGKARDNLLSLITFLPPYLQARCGDEVIMTPEREIVVPFEFDKRANIKGIIDMTCKVNGELKGFFDLKTTKDSIKWYWVDWASNTQKSFYDYLLLKAEGKLPEFFGYVVTNYLERVIFVKEMESEMKEGYFDDMAKSISAIMDFIENPAFVDNSAYKWHKHCPYSKICPMGGYLK